MARPNFERFYLRQGAAPLYVPMHEITGWDAAAVGDLIGKGASDTLAMVAAASLGGSGGAGGGLTLLQTVTISSPTATADLAGFIDDTYDEYEVHFALVPVTDNVHLHMRLSSNAGSSYDAGASDYRYTFGRQRDGSASAFDLIRQSGAADHLRIAENIGSDTGEGVAGVVRTSTMRSTTLRKLMQWDVADVSDTAEMAWQKGGGFRVSSSAFNAIRLLFSSGNIESGWVRLYGVTKTAPSSAGVIYDSGYFAGGAATIDSLAVIPGTYTSLQIEVLARTTQAALDSGYALRLNNDSGSNYLRVFVRGNNNTTSSNNSSAETGCLLICPGASASGSIFGSAIFTIPFYGSGGSHNKVINFIDGTVGDLVANRYVNTQACRWFSNVAITRVSITANSGNLAAGCRMIIRGL